MNYLKKSFSVGALPTDEYRSEWERIFGKKPAEKPEAVICDHCRKSVPEVLTHGGLLLCKKCMGDQ